MFEAANVEKGMTSITGDIRDLPSFINTFNAHSPEIVFHMAAQSLVRRSYTEPVETYATNVMGTVNLLEAVRNTPSVRSVVVITSDKCYENREWVWGYRETESMGGHDPYSSSKGCAELVTQVYRKSFFTNKGQVGIASARAGNVIGGGDWAEDRLIPDIARALSSNKPVVLRRPNAIRPWQHVLEPLRGYLMLGEHLWKQSDDFSEAWNFGPRDEETITVREMTERIIQHWGSGELVIGGADDLHEAHYLKLDCSKARAKLGWRPLLTIDEALEMTVAWYRSYLEDPGSAGSTTASQINGYMERLSR